MKCQTCNKMITDYKYLPKNIDKHFRKERGYYQYKQIACRNCKTVYRETFKSKMTIQVLLIIGILIFNYITIYSNVIPVESLRLWIDASFLNKLIFGLVFISLISLTSVRLLTKYEKVEKQKRIKKQKNNQ